MFVAPCLAHLRKCSQLLQINKSARESISNGYESTRKASVCLGQSLLVDRSIQRPDSKLEGCYILDIEQEELDVLT